MAASKADKDAYALISYYSKLYKDKYGRSITVNKYKEKWGMASLIEDFGREDVSFGLEYYFRLNREGHPLQWFYSNFSTVHNNRLAAEKDAMIREESRARTKELRAEYLNGLS